MDWTAAGAAVVLAALLSDFTSAAAIPDGAALSLTCGIVRRAVSGSIRISGTLLPSCRSVRTLCMTMAYAGCRLSEALALTADRADLAAGVLSRIWRCSQRDRLPFDGAIRSGSGSWRAGHLWLRTRSSVAHWSSWPTRGSEPKRIVRAASCPALGEPARLHVFTAALAEDLTQSGWNAARHGRILGTAPGGRRGRTACRN